MLTQYDLKNIEKDLQKRDEKNQFFNRLLQDIFKILNYPEIETFKEQTKYKRFFNFLQKKYSYFYNNYKNEIDLIINILSN